MTPTLEFLERNPQMLGEMIADFQQRKKIVDMAKTKEPIDANVVDNPNLRAQLPYPRMMYNHATRQTLVINDWTEHQAANQAGWKEEPWRNVDPGVPVGPQATADGSDERLDSLERRMMDMERALGEILEAIKERRKPGRPPNNPQG